MGIVEFTLSDPTVSSTDRNDIECLPKKPELYHNAQSLTASNTNAFW